jgi:hypothetical protein
LRQAWIEALLRALEMEVAEVQGAAGKLATTGED